MLLPSSVHLIWDGFGWILSLRETTVSEEPNMFTSVFTDELGLDLSEALPILQSWGLTHVDLRGRILGGSFENLTDEQLAEVKGLLGRHSLKVGCLESSLAKVHLPGRERREAEAAKLERIVRAADALGCRLVRAFFYWQPGEEEAGRLAENPDALRKVLEAFSPLAERAKQEGLVLGFENCGVTSEEVFRVLDALDEPRWGLAWDVANGWWTSEERTANLATYMNRLAGRTRVVHVKARGAVQGLGELIPYDRVLQALSTAGFQGPVSIETHNPDRSASNVEQTHRALERVRRAWPSAAPGMVNTAEPPRPDVERDYEPVGLVVVGLGMGRSRAKTVQATPGTRLVGVCDIDKERARTCGEELGVPWTSELAPWLKNEDVEAVYVLTPTGRHAEVALPALQAGKHVLLTKPMEASLGACDAMIRLARGRGLLLAVDFEMRFDTFVLSLREAVSAGQLGRVLGGQVSLKVLRTMEYFRANGGWRGTRRWDGGGVLSNQTVHHIDQVAYVLGVPDRVRCDIWTQTHDIEAEDLGCAVWQYADGATVSLCATTSYPHHTWYFELELHGSKGAVSTASGGPLQEQRERWFLDGVWVGGPPRKVQSPWINAADNFAAAVRTGAPLACSGSDGRRTQSILDAMYRSAYGQRGWVDVEPEPPA